MKYLFTELKHIWNELFVRCDVQAEYQELKVKGFFVKENFLTKMECDLLISQVESYVENGCISWIDEVESDIRIFNFSSDVFSTNDHLDLYGLYAKYISSKTCNKFIMANKLVYRENNKGSGGGWHRDNLNKRQLKFMIYLNDVDEYGGAFEYIPESHKVSSKLLTNSFNNYFRYDLDDISKLYPNKSIKLSGRAGTLIAFDSSGLHRGSPILKGKRYALTQYMFDGEVPLHIKKLFV